MSTGHANSPKDMLHRLETMVLMGLEIPRGAIRAQIASGIDIIVHLGRLRDKSRKVLEIDEIMEYRSGEISLNKLFEFTEFGEEEGKVLGELVRTKNRLLNVEKLKRSGLIRGENNDL
jgi:pilus assembly protein CpaF